MDERWRTDLAGWGIPAEIAAAARSDPWEHSPARFGERTDRALAVPEGPTLLRAAEALPPGGSVLDVGAGTGAASLPLARLGGLIAVDTSAAMLAELEVRAGRLGVPVRPVLGRWPDVAGETPPADVAVAAHVVYNVPDLSAFLAALTAHARHRVVLELTHRHPMSWLSPLWAHFHGLVRPTRPTADDVAALARRLGYGVRQEERPAPLPRFPSLEAMAESACRRLCLDPARAEEVVAAAVELDMWPVLRDRWVTLWWDTA
ncbi:methyltransferase domain-containing protein [Planomonospora sp. ID82291]|nr:methyltransferase domain-containing protein [Planomonospora sp. ID82291]